MVRNSRSMAGGPQIAAPSARWADSSRGMCGACGESTSIAYSKVGKGRVRQTEGARFGVRRW